jgi:hypothetical protein
LLLTNTVTEVFPNSEISLSVEESVSVGYILYTSAADDKDTGFNNSVQTYELVPGNEMFGLDVKTGVLSLVSSKETLI